LLKVALILAYEPLAQVTIDLVHAFLEFSTGDVLIGVDQLGILNSIEKALRQRLGVGLDQPNETI
jgi:hypothetical protein